MALFNDNFKTATLGVSLAASGPLGTAATTVDIASSFILTATAAALVVTLPAPTDALAGDRILVKTVTNSATVNGILIPVGTFAPFMWDGTAWINDANVGRNMGAAILVASITVGNNTITHNLTLPSGSFSNVVVQGFNSTGNQVVFRRVLGSDTTNSIVVNSTVALTNITFYISPLA